MALAGVDGAVAGGATDQLILFHLMSLVECGDVDVARLTEAVKRVGHVIVQPKIVAECAHMGSIHDVLEFWSDLSCDELKRVAAQV